MIQPVQRVTGKIITSGKAVHGSETTFNKELEVGDFIIIDNVSSGEQERRKVNMVLSLRSCGIEEPFSTDIINKQDFLYQKKPKLKERVKAVDDVINERLALEKAHTQAVEEEEVEFRVKKGGAYEYVKEKVKGGLSKEDLLDIRVKKKTDKFCWF